MSAQDIERDCEDDPRISCFDIQVFHLNQRIARNPKHAEIKESIRNKGLQDPLKIVFHPDRHKWVLSQGGQTRLLICRELYKETNEERFLYPSVSKQKFTSDLNTCVSHLIENHLRADNSYAETARAVKNIRDIIKARDGQEPSQMKLHEELGQAGMPLRRQSLTGMLYFSDELAPYITNVRFNEEVSRKQIDAIRSLRKELSSDMSMSGDEFDSKLVQFINSHESNPPISKIKKHFKPTTTHEVVPTREFNVTPTEKSPTGCVVQLPKQIDSKKEAEAYFFVASLTGVFDCDASQDALELMGVPAEDGSQQDFLETVLDRLELKHDDLPGLPGQLLLLSDDCEFESLVNLIIRLRKCRRGSVCMQN